MENNIKLGVYRINWNLFDPIRDIEYHNLRKNALHEVLDNRELVQVINWEKTDDTAPHEYVEILLTATVMAVIKPIIFIGIEELGKKLAEKAIDQATSEFLKWIISKLIKKQKEKKISDFNIQLKDGTLLHIEPPDGKSEITINFVNGEVETIKYQLDKHNKQVQSTI